MTTLKNVKEIVLKGKNIRDVDTTSITMPTPVYENGEIKTDPQTGEIIYNPPLDTLKTDTLLTETSLPIAYSLKDKELDPTSPNFKNEVLTLSAATELKTKTKSDTLKILENSEHQKQYQFADNSPESFGENENKDALSVGVFKDTLTSGIEFSKEHNSEISDNFMTEKVFKDRYVYSKLHFNENNLSDVDLTDTTTRYIKSTITYSQPSTDNNIIIGDKEFSIYTNNDSTTINILIDGMKIQIIDTNTNTSRFTINNNASSNKCILATYSTMTDSRYCQTDNVNNTYNVPANIFNATLLENGLYEGVWDKSTPPKPFKINYGVINNERVFKAIAEDKNIIDVYTHFDENNEIVYHKLVLYSSSTKAEYIIYKYNFEKYDSSKTYTTYTETLNGPDEKNSNITFRNLQIKYTYASQPVIVDASQISSELLPEVKHKLLTTEALSNAYVNSLDLKNQEWYDENKDKLITVEAMKDVEISSEKEHLQIANINGVNKYQFGNSEPVEFDSSETSTKPLSVNVLADTKTTPFEFSKTEVFNNNLMTEKALEDTYINDKLLFSKTLTTSDENTEISDTTIDPEIEHKLVTTDTLNEAYVNSLDMDNNEWMNENKYKLVTVEALNNNNFKSFDKSLSFQKDNLTVSEDVDLNKVNSEIVGKSIKPENLTNAYVNDKLVFADDLGIPFADGKSRKIINYTVGNVSGVYNTCNYFTSESTEPTFFKLPVYYLTDSEPTFKNLSFKLNEGNIIFEVRPYGSNIYCIQCFKENNNYKIRLRIDKSSTELLLFDYNLTTNVCTYKLNGVNQNLTEMVNASDNKYIYLLDDDNINNSFKIQYSTTKIIKFDYTIDNHKLGEFVLYYMNNVSDDDMPFKIFIDYYCYTDLENNEYIEYKETINLIDKEIYDSSKHDEYTQNIQLNKLHTPDNNLFRFTVNRGIKTYNQSQVQDESLMEDVDYNFEIEHKLLTTDALNDAYVNSLDMDNNKWMNENKYKLVTVEALNDIKVEGVEDKLLFAKTLTTNENNTEIEDKTLDPEIEDKLIKTDALDNAYTKNKLTFIKDNLTNIDLIDTETKYIKSILSVDSDHTNNLQIINSSTLETIKNYGLDLVESNRTLTIKSGTFRIQYLPNHGETRYIFNVRATSSQGYQALIMIGDNENRNKYVQTNNPNNSWTFPDRIYDSVY